MTDAADLPSLPARFITFEGGEGVGKSTQCAALSAYLAARNIPCITTREPGGCPGAEAVRDLLRADPDPGWHPVSEALLLFAARREHWERRIRPALKQGQWVICDRFADSSLVYQGIGRGLGQGWINDLRKLSLPAAAWPDLTLILDLAPAEALTRATARGDVTHYETMPMAFHHAVRSGFHALAQNDPERCRLIPADGDAATVGRAVRAALVARFGSVAQA